MRNGRGILLENYAILLISQIESHFLTRKAVLHATSRTGHKLMLKSKIDSGKKLLTILRFEQSYASKDADGVANSVEPDQTAPS